MSQMQVLKIFTVTALGVALSLTGALADYDTWPASKKQDWLWQKITSDTHGDSFMNPLKTILKVESPAYLLDMERISADWREPGHHKATHGVGAHAKAHFAWKENNYTGMFQQADNCIIRMANAAAPGGIAMGPYGPNLAVKCLRDGSVSANMQFIWQVDGYAVMPKGIQKSCSYFETPLSNHNPMRDDISIALKDTFVKCFQNYADRRSMFVGLSQMGYGTQSGNAHDIKGPHINVPFALVLEPTQKLNSVKCTFDQPISQLLNLEAAGLGVPGKTLYDVYAVRNPSDRQPDGTYSVPATPELIGSLVLDSAFTASTWGDTELFFQHTFWSPEMTTLGLFGDPDDSNTKRLKKWDVYVNDDDVYKTEGANLYWSLLPGGPKELAQIAARNVTSVSELMLETDIIV